MTLFHRFIVALTGLAIGACFEAEGEAQTPAGAGTPLDGWSSFVLTKTDAELSETRRLAEDPRFAPRENRSLSAEQPPQYDLLHLSAGIGYLQGADWGSDIGAYGKLFGAQTDLNAFVTAGPLGLQMRSGFASLLDADRRWGAQAGDLFSDLRGLARGARLSWPITERWAPTVSVYIRNDAISKNAPTVVTYRDRFQLTKRIQIGGEVASNGSAVAQGRYTWSKLDTDVFYRYKAEDRGTDGGVSGALEIGRGVTLAGSVRGSNTPNDTGWWQLASIRVPFFSHGSVSFERTWWDSSPVNGAINAVTIQVPLGRLRLLQRVQWGRTEYVQRAVPFGFDRRQMQSMVAYNFGPWGNLTYQQSTQWLDDGHTQQWDELISTVRLGERTQLEAATALPGQPNPSGFRARLIRQLPGHFAIEAQYGRLSAFQTAPMVGTERSRLLLMIRKSVDVQSPARGGEVRGRVLDQARDPVIGAIVRLGPYHTTTAWDGGYAFLRVPDGRFELSLDAERLPANYEWGGEPQTIDVTSRTSAFIDLTAVPLGTVQGHVYLDRNGNGRLDPGEGTPNVVVSLDEKITVTDSTGAYGFYNQPPGPHIVRLNAARLPKDIAPAGPSELHVELLVDHPLLRVDFTVEKHDKPVVMQDMELR